MRKYLSSFSILIIISVIIPLSVPAQNRKFDKVIDQSNFDHKIFNDCILDLINSYRKGKTNDIISSNELLSKASDIQSQYMSDKQEVTLENTGKLKTTDKRVISLGGSKNVDELVSKANIPKGKDTFTYYNLCKEIVAKWAGNNKTEIILNDPKWIFAGVSNMLDKDRKKVYVSVVFGNYTSFNNGVKKISLLNVPYTTKNPGIKSYNYKICKKCEKFPLLEDLSKAISVREGQVWFTYKELRKLKKLLKNSSDGFAVDVIQKEQYSCQSENILDNTLNNKGVLLKPVYKDKIYKNNIHRKEKKIKLIETPLGDFPKGIVGEYEINLIILQNKVACRTIIPTYVETGSGGPALETKLLIDTTSIKFDSNYIPRPENTTLTFKVPFEKSKYTYKQEDVEPFLNALNEPDFTINEVDIKAFSSIEGTENINQELQKKRAESIVEALKKRQKREIKTHIQTSDSWDQFVEDIKGTKYGNLAAKNAKEANEYIMARPGLLTQLEPILAKHRYAEIILDVTFDIAGEKEEPFVISKFNKMMKKEEIEQAFSIMKYISKKIESKQYSKKAVTGLNIPDGKAYDVFRNNKVALESWVTKEKPDDENCKILNDCWTNLKQNAIYNYNRLYCNIIHTDFTTLEQVSNIQSTIDELYSAILKKDEVDALNLELQFKSLTLLDSLDKTGGLSSKAYERIKSIVNIKETSWSNSLQLSFIFMNHGDFDYALKLLDPYIYEKQLPEDFYFTYISLCGHFQARIMSNRFAYAVKKAAELDKRRFCKLFKADKASFQLFDNPTAKDSYCKSCN